MTYLFSISDKYIMVKSVLIAFPLEFTSQVLAKSLMENGNI